MPKPRDLSRDLPAVDLYALLKLYERDFWEAAGSLALLKRYRRSAVRERILRDFIVCYCRPFSGNNGKRLRKHRLPVAKVVPTDNRPLHLYLVGVRNQLIAHTDSARPDPTITAWDHGDRCQLTMTFWGLSYPQLMARLPEFEALLLAVQAGLERMVARAEATLLRLA